MNTFIEGKDFWISYNPFTDKGAETALCRETARPNYLILLGDYTADFEPLVSQGYDACLEKFKQLVNDGAEMSGWSESLDEEEDVQVAPGIWQSKEDYEANRDYDAMKDGENFV